MEQEYFKSIYELYYQPLFLYAFSLCKNKQDAEDLVQSTFLKALEQLIKNEEKRKLYQLIGRLPELQKRVLLDTVYFQLNDEEIAKGNNISRENVRQVRSRAKKKLLELVREEER